MTRSQFVAATLLAMQAAIQFLLATQQDVTIPPPLKVALGVGAVIISVYLTVLKIQPSPPSVTVPGGAGPITGGDA